MHWARPPDERGPLCDGSVTREKKRLSLNENAVAPCRRPRASFLHSTGGRRQRGRAQPAVRNAPPHPTSALSLRVRAKDVVADGVVSLALDHPDGVRLPDWTPGAHIAFVLPDGTTRQYSLCGDL